MAPTLISEVTAILKYWLKQRFFMARILVIPSVLFLSVFPVPQSKEYVNCPESAGWDVGRAYVFLVRYAPTVADRWQTEYLPRLDSKMRKAVDRGLRDFKRRFSNVWQEEHFQVGCRDNSPDCSSREHLRGWAPPWSKKGNVPIRICYANHIADKATFCDLVDTLAHEAGHKVGVPMTKRHNEAAADRHNDPVYQLGWAAAQVCQEAASRGEVDPGLIGAAKPPGGS